MTMVSSESSARACLRGGRGLVGLDGFLADRGDAGGCGHILEQGRHRRDGRAHRDVAGRRNHLRFVVVAIAGGDRGVDGKCRLLALIDDLEGGAGAGSHRRDGQERGGDGPPKAGCPTAGFQREYAARQISEHFPAADCLAAFDMEKSAKPSLPRLTNVMERRRAPLAGSDEVILADILKTHEALAAALAILAAGGIVAVPTETVYGLAGRRHPTAVGRGAHYSRPRAAPHFNPLIAPCGRHGRLAEGLAEFRCSVGARAGRRLLARPADAGAAAETGLGHSSAGHRWPGDRGGSECRADIAHELIAAFGPGRWQRPAPIRPAASPQRRRKRWPPDLGDRLELIVDGGRAPVGVESTIVKVEPDGVRVLRPGGQSRPTRSNRRRG